MMVMWDVNRRMPEDWGQGGNGEKTVLELQRAGEMNSLSSLVYF